MLLARIRQQKKGYLVFFPVKTVVQQQMVVNYMMMDLIPLIHLLKSKLVKGNILKYSKGVIINKFFIRDQYGFLKSTQWITEDEFNGFENHYAPIMKRRLLKWRQLLSDNNDQWPAKSSKGKWTRQEEENVFLTHFMKLNVTSERESLQN